MAKAEQVRAKKMELQKPSYRVRRALARLSRDKWLAPDDARKAAYAFSCCCSGTPSHTAKRALPIECWFVGMIRGQPPAWRFEENYGRVVDAVKRIKSNRLADAILVNLKQSKQIRVEQEPAQ